MKKYDITFGDRAWIHDGNDVEHALSDLLSKQNFSQRVIPEKYKLIEKGVDELGEWAAFSCTYKGKKREIYVTERQEKKGLYFVNPFDK